MGVTVSDLSKLSFARAEVQYGRLQKFSNRMCMCGGIREIDFNLVHLANRDLVGKRSAAKIQGLFQELE